MTHYEEDIILITLAEIITNCKSDTEPTKGHGLYLNGTWLTPEQCYTIANVIEEHNNARYGEGNWKLDKELIETLRKGTN